MSGARVERELDELGASLDRLQISWRSGRGRSGALHGGAQGRGNALLLRQRRERGGCAAPRRRSTSSATRKPAGTIRDRAHHRHVAAHRGGQRLGFDHIFSRQVEALGAPGDLLIIHVRAASRRTCSPRPVRLAKRGAGPSPSLAPAARCASSSTSRSSCRRRTGRIQILHLALEHLIVRSWRRRSCPPHDLARRANRAGHRWHAGNRRAAAICLPGGADVAIGYPKRPPRPRRSPSDPRALGRRAVDIRRTSRRTGGREMDGDSARRVRRLDFFVANAGIWPADDVPLADNGRRALAAHDGRESRLDVLHDAGGASA